MVVAGRGQTQHPEQPLPPLPESLLQTLQPLLDEDTALLTRTISAVGIAQSSGKAQRLLRSGEFKDENNSPVARASPSSSSSSSSISKSSSFWERIPTSSPTGSSMEEDAGTLEASPPWGSQLSPTRVHPAEWNQPRMSWSSQWWRVPVPRAASTALPHLDTAGTAFLGSPGTPQRGGSPVSRSLLLPARDCPEGSSCRAPATLSSGKRRKCIISLTVSGFSPFWGLSPSSPVVPHRGWHPCAGGAQLCPPEPQGRVSHASSHRKSCCSPSPEADAKGRVAGRISYHRSNGGLIGHHSWLLLAAPSCLTWSQCHEGHPELCLARSSILGALDATAGCQHGDHDERFPTLGVSKGPGKGFLSHSWVQWAEFLRPEGILPLTQGWPLTTQILHILALHREAVTGGVMQVQAVHADCSHHSPARGTARQCARSRDKTPSHGHPTRISKGEQHGDGKIANMKQYFPFAPDNVHLQRGTSYCDITGW